MRDVAVILERLERDRDGKANKRIVRPSHRDSRCSNSSHFGSLGSHSACALYQLDSSGQFEMGQSGLSINATNLSSKRKLSLDMH